MKKMSYFTVPYCLDFEVEADTMGEAVGKVDEFIDKFIEERKNVITEKA